MTRVLENLKIATRQFWWTVRRSVVNTLLSSVLAVVFFLALIPGCWFSDVDQTREDGPEKPQEGGGPTGEVPDLSSHDAKIRDLLESKTVSLDFEDTLLSAVVNSLRKQSGAEILVDSAVYSTKTEAELMVNLEVDEIPLGAALRLIVGYKGLALIVDCGIILITTKQDLPEVGLRIVDVRYLLAPLDGYSADIKLSSSSEETMPPMLEEDEEDDTMTVDEIISLVREGVFYGNWDTPPNQITYRQGNLIVRNQSDVIEEVLALLKRLREQK
jgi:hypothetical protein